VVRAASVAKPRAKITASLYERCERCERCERYEQYEQYERYERYERPIGRTT
jgi:uracil-DNA glycosylase